ncbi:MAG: hypothetical protein A2289_14835 [Deltaproteobacteria bacterium RIFOXYA12_FULL_58_15]|nr:MAG: hypothetical protein A2289_14835 [Deltaproteobacteria bacterium RIFOXYA12_FULL_58_15]OGR09766.1 MAG: hypothetical protein A2341_13215 [Deltaproteobacteria bacterium RIFOXYB12_FULL_58_9]
MQLLLGSVCALIPLLGPIVYVGYLTEVIVAQHRHGEETYPVFDFDNFSRYLKRGIWPFLVQLVVGLFALPVLAFSAAPLLAIPLLDLHEPEIIAPIAATILLFSFAMVLMVVFILPLTIRAALLQDFKNAFSWTFAKGFVARVWSQIILAQLFLIAAMFPMMIFGFATCGLGYYPVITVIMFASWQLHRQLYELYLVRGGEPIEISHSFLQDPHPSRESAL